MIRKNASAAWRVARRAVSILAANDPFRMAGATAFFTTFALPPILMVIVRVFGIFLDRRRVGLALIEPLRGVFGDDSLDSVLQTIRSFRALGQNYLIAGGIFIFLLFVATTLFKVIRTSINEIWSIRLVPHSGLRQLLISRAISVAVILAGGLFFLSVQLVDAGQHLLGAHVSSGLARASHYAGKVLNFSIVTAITSFWFYLLFYYLPDGRPRRRVAIGGALITGILFTAGKLVLSVLLKPVQVSNFYGVSGAFALVLLFMFYSSLFLYFGAALIAAWGDDRGTPIVPKPHAERYRVETEQPE